MGDLPEALLAEQFVEVGDNLVEQTQALHALVVALQFHVELGEVGYAGEQNAHRVALLVVQVLQQSQSQIQLQSWWNWHLFMAVH